MWKNALKLFLLSLVIAAASCAPRRIEIPSYEGADIREYLSEMRKISGVETRMSLALQKEDTQMRGEGALNISNGGDMSLRIYSLGFLAMELTSSDGVVKSDPPLDRNKKLILTKGLRDCLFWWDAEPSGISEDNGHYVLKRPDRIVWIDRKTFLPVKQQIFFDNDRVINVYYEEPAKEKNIWYQSRIRIELAQYSVTVKIKEISFRM